MVTGFSKEVRELVAQRAGADLDVDRYITCEVMVRCPGRVVAAWDLHHRRPRGMGGTKREESNMPAAALAACRDCHRYIEEHRDEALQNGWLVPQHHTPSEIPVLYRHRWMLLGDDGTVSEAQCVCGEITDSGWYPGPCSCLGETR